MRAVADHESRARLTLLDFGVASWGLAAAIALLPFWLRPASPGQLPGFMTFQGYDPNASFRFIAGVIALPLVATIVFRPLRSLLARPAAAAWALPLAASALASALWSALLSRQLAWVALPPLAVVALALAMRRVQTRFTRRDLMLLPAVMTVYLAALDVAPSLHPHHLLQLSAFAVVVLRIALAMPRGGLSPDRCFVFAPLGMALQSHFNGYEQRHSPWLPLLIAFATPVAMRMLAPNTPRTRSRLRAITAFAVLPIVAVSYGSATSILAAEGKPRADLFENAHTLVPATEMLRGERPYRDIIPAHGLVQDGLLDFLILRGGPVTAGHAVELHGVLGVLNRVAGYALGAALTGSAEVGLLAWILGVILGTGGGTIRPLPALLALALMASAIRTGRWRVLAFAGAAFVAAVFTSLDFAAYALLALAAILARVPSPARRRALLAALAGTAIASAIAAVPLLALGIVDDFFRTTLGEIFGLAPVYALMPFSAPDVLKARPHLPEVVGALFDRTAWLYIVWPAMLLVWAVAIVRPRDRATRRRRIAEAILAPLTFAIVSAVSFAERQHLYFMYVIGPLFAATLYFFWRSRRKPVRHGTVAAAILIVVIGWPTAHMSQVALLRRHHGPLDAAWIEIADVPRAANALYRTSDAERIRRVRDYLQRELKPGETFFDFTNNGALYFLLDRDCPIRQVEVAFYERRAQQREVIARLQANRNVRVALMPSTVGDATVDGVPNEVRAPLVAEWIRRNFRPHEAAGEITFWRRVD